MAYMMFPSTARVVAAQLTANDFKQHTGVQLNQTTSTFDEVGADGEIKHGSLNDRSYTYSVNTYARMFGITRRDLINDDVGVFEQMPRIIAQGALKKLERIFWELVLGGVGSGDFFDTATGLNYISGASSDLGIDGLKLAVQKMTEAVDGDGDPLFVTPKYLVVSPADEILSSELFSALTVNVAAANADTTARLPNINPIAGKYQPLTCPWIGAQSTVTGAGPGPGKEYSRQLSFTGQFDQCVEIRSWCWSWSRSGSCGNLRNNRLLEDDRLAHDSAGAPRIFCLIG